MAFASTANAGITIPAGDWTLDIGGVVNAYYTTTRTSGDDDQIAGGAFSFGGSNANGRSRTNNITTGLLPNYLSVSGKTRQNDLDIGFTISINPGASTTGALDQTANQENRQAFMTIGDASWGSVKIGKDLGLFASDAILNDMTLLGVGSGAGFLAGNTTTTGRIGNGFMYADWKSQIAYTSPNWNGFQFTGGVTQGFDGTQGLPAALGGGGVAATDGRSNSTPAIEAKASYSWTGDVSGKVWASGISQKHQTQDQVNGGTRGERAFAYDVGANVNVAGFGLTGYYYKGEGIGLTGQFLNGFDAFGKRRDSDGGYVQATYALPTATKIGVSWGQSKLELNNAPVDVINSMWTVGAYHPLTKSVNLVAEYSRAKTDIEIGGDADIASRAKTVSLGAILFF